MNDKFLYEYKGSIYPNYLKSGNACSYILSFAKQFCIGKGLDIGGYLDWVFPGAQVINVALNDQYHALNLPPGKFDYIFSSHTLEHVPNYISALRLWHESLVVGGVLFLYLPHPEMQYWLPQNNNKHLHMFEPSHMVNAFYDIGFTTVIHSERDLYWSFSVVGFK